MDHIHTEYVKAVASEKVYCRHVTEKKRVEIETTLLGGNFLTTPIHPCLMLHSTHEVVISYSGQV